MDTKTLIISVSSLGIVFLFLFFVLTSKEQIEEIKTPINIEKEVAVTTPEIIENEISSSSSIISIIEKKEIEKVVEKVQSKEIIKEVEEVVELSKEEKVLNYIQDKGLQVFDNRPQQKNLRYQIYSNVSKTELDHNQHNNMPPMVPTIVDIKNSEGKSTSIVVDSALFNSKRDIIVVEYDDNGDMVSAIDIKEQSNNQNSGSVTPPAVPTF